MTRTNRSTRRSFIAIAGAAISAPVAAAAATLPGRIEPDPLKMRLARLEDLNEIRGLNQTYFQRVAAGEHEDVRALFANPAKASVDAGICGISPMDFGERDVIEVSEDRQTATARLHAFVHTETAPDPDCTLAEMARQQGSDRVASTDPAVFENRYVRQDGTWKLGSVRRVRGM